MVKPPTDSSISVNLQSFILSLGQWLILVNILIEEIFFFFFWYGNFRPQGFSRLDPISNNKYFSWNSNEIVDRLSVKVEDRVLCKRGRCVYGWYYNVFSLTQTIWNRFLVTFKLVCTPSFCYTTLETRDTNPFDAGYRYGHLILTHPLILLGLFYFSLSSSPFTRS